MLVTQRHAGQRLHFEFKHGVFLQSREIAHLRLGKLDIAQILRTQLCQAGIDVPLAEAEFRGMPIVELCRQLTHRRVTARIDIGQNGFHRGADLLIRLRARRSILAALEPYRHACFSSNCCACVQNAR